MGDKQAGSRGTLACVGVGMMLGAHLAPRARAHIETAEVVFVVASNPIVELWLREIRPDSRSLQGYYAEGKSRHLTYREMVATVLCEVREGRSVCIAFYGHPGVFAKVAHDAIEQARREGARAFMEPGISAEDCLYADLGIDPGRYGCQHYEAGQLLIYQRCLNTSAYLVLWQVGFAGDRSYRRFSTGAAHRALLVERLSRDYPLDHDVIVYEAATLPIHVPRMERVSLGNLCDIELHPHSTLVVPPARALVHDREMLARLESLEASIENASVLPIN